MSAFAGTPLEMALRDLGIRAFAIAGVTLEIGIGPSVWHAVDLGFIPVVVTDACGGRDRPAMLRVLDDIRFAGDALLTDIATITPAAVQPSGPVKAVFDSVPPAIVIGQEPKPGQGATESVRSGTSSHSPPGKGDSRHVVSALRGDKPDSSMGNPPPGVSR